MKGSDAAGCGAGLDAEARGEMGHDAVQCHGAGGSAATKRFHLPFGGEIHESPFNPLKNPQQLEADHQPGWPTSSTLK